jgi:ubiquinone/menaquinone biosynthesis C-methylase UbiE
MIPESQSLLETQVKKINLQHFSGKGLILDIGGGGEGLVSRIDGDRTCALDIRMSEIREAQIHGQSSNWFAADGANLCFNDEVFDIVTLWFSLGYMNNWTTKHAVFEAAHRVLKKNGRLSIMASRIPESNERLIFWAEFTLPDGTNSRIGYGVKGGQNQTLPRILELATKVGFGQHLHEDHDEWFKVESRKL